MKRIVFVIGGMTRGGAERVISILANEYAEKGYEVYIILMLDNIVQYKLHQNITIVNLTGYNTGRIAKIPYWIYGLKKAFRDIKPDVIVSFVARINILVLLATIGINSRVIISERNDPSKDGRSKAVKLATNILYPMADKIIFQTNRAKNCFGRRIQEKSEIISNPISVETLAKTEKKDKIVTVGRLAPQKNQKMLIDAFSIILNQYPDYNLWIYGEGSLRNFLTTYINEKQLEDKVHLAGNVDNVHECISDAKVFALTSDYEGLSNALLEAMMMGMTCIATECAGSDEYIQNNYNGILIPINNLDALVSALLDLLHDEEKCIRLGDNAKKSVEKCNKSYVLDKWHNAIDG